MGYVSHELVKAIKEADFVFDQDKINDVLKDNERITIEKAFVILKRAETRKASEPGFVPDVKLADDIATAIWVLEGSGKWTIHPQTYQRVVGYDLVLPRPNAIKGVVLGFL